MGRKLATIGRSPDARALAIVAAAVVLANGLYLLGVVDPNPLGPKSGLTVATQNGALVGLPTIDPNIGYSSQALGHLAASDLLHLRLPWWNPYEATGAPLAGEMQSAALFAPTLLLIFPGGQLYEHILLELIAGWCTYLLLRRIDVRRAAAIAAAIAFALNGTFAWLGHAPVNPVAFLPMILLGVEQAYAAALNRTRGGWWLIAVGGAFSVYGGFPETAYADGLLVVVWLGWRLTCLERIGARALLLKAGAGAAVTLALSAPLLIAFLGYLPHADIGGHAGQDNASLPGQGLAQLFLPYVYGPIFAFSDPHGILGRLWGSVGGYLTPALLLFGLFGLRARGRSGLRWWLAGWLTLAIGRMYGVPGLRELLGLVPGMSSVEFWRYGAPSVEFAAVVLAAIGLDRLSGAALPARSVIEPTVAALVVVIVACLAAASLVDAASGGGTPSHYLALSVAGATIVVLAGGAVALRGGRFRLRLACALLAIEAAGMFAFPELSAPSSVAIDLAPVRYLSAHLGDQRFFTLGPIQPNYGAYFRLASLNDNDLPLPQDFARYVHTQLDPVVTPYLFVGTENGGRPPTAPTPAAQLLRYLQGYRDAATTYVLTPPGMSLPAPLATVVRTPDAWIYAVPDPAPFFAAPGCAVSANGLQSFRLRCAAATVAVRRETFLPGWSAQVDGRSVAVREADRLFQAVDVPAGASSLSFSYVPPGIGWGYGLLALGLGLLVAGATRSRLGPALAGRAVTQTRAAPPPARPADADRQVAPSRRAVAGRVEEIGGGVVSGWAWCPSAPGWRVGVRAMIDGEEVGRAVADLPRPSLRREMIGDGNHGFRIPLNTARRDWRGRTLRVEADSGIALPAAATFDVPGDSPGGPAIDSGTRDRAVRAVAGYVEQCEDGVVSGWVWRPEMPTARVPVWLVVDGREIAAAVAELARPSLLAAGIGDGRHGFRFELPASGREDLPRRVRIETDMGLALPPARGYRSGPGDGGAAAYELDVSVDGSRGLGGVDLEAGLT